VVFGEHREPHSSDGRLGQCRAEIVVHVQGEGHEEDVVLCLFDDLEEYLFGPTGVEKRAAGSTDDKFQRRVAAGVIVSVRCGGHGGAQH